MKTPSSNQPPRFIVALRQTLLAELLEAVVTQGVSLLALTAPAGTGKTTLASALQHDLVDRSVHVLRIGRGEGCRLDLRAVACQVLGKPEADFNADDIEALFDVMTVRCVPDQKLVLIIDDAELLGTDVLGYFRLLWSIAMEEMPQIVFVGRTSFWDAPEHPSRADIRELITDRRELAPLSEVEARTFAEVAAPECVFGEGAVDALVRHGNGSIGRIASLLVLARGGGDDGHPPRLAVAAIDGAAARLDADPASDAGDGDTVAETPPVVTEPAPSPDASRPRRRLRFAPTVGAAMVMATAGIAIYWQALVHGDRMRAEAGSIHDMATTAAAVPIVVSQDTKTPQADAVSADVSMPAAGPATSAAQASVPVSVDADAPTIGELLPVPVPPPRIDQTWRLADILDHAAYAGTAVVASADDNNRGPVQTVPASAASDPAVAETPVQPTMQAPEAPPPIGPLADSLQGEVAAQQEPVAPAVPQHDDTPRETAAPVLRSEAAPADGTPVSHEAAVAASTAGADRVAAPRTDLPGGPAASMPQHDDTLPDASVPVLQAEAPATGTPIPDAAAVAASTAGADRVAAPHTDLPGGPAASMPQHDDTLPDASVPVVQAEAPATGTPIPDAAAVAASTAGPDRVAAPLTDLPGAPVASVPQHDDTLPDRVPVLQAEAPATGTPIAGAAAVAASTAGPDRVAAPHTDLPGAPAATLDAKAAKVTATATVSTPDLAPLLSRGDAMLALGDISAARLFYERAVTQGSARGATALGKTYDPAFLASIRATGVTSNRDLAATWYRRGAELGDTEGTRRLATLTSTSKR